jgi:DNA-binding IscR family transcriptional regulator
MEGISSNGEKVYNAMKQSGMTSEDRMANVDRIGALSKLPKNFVIQALQELEKNGYVKRKAREKSAGYFVLK